MKKLIVFIYKSSIGLTHCQLAFDSGPRGPARVRALLLNLTATTQVPVVQRTIKPIQDSVNFDFTFVTFHGECISFDLG